MIRLKPSNSWNIWHRAALRWSLP